MSTGSLTRNFYKSLAPFYYTSCLSGLCPLLVTFKPNGGRANFNSSWKLIYSTLYIALNLLGGIYSLDKLYTADKVSLNLKVVAFVQCLMVIIMQVVSICNGYIYTKQTIRLIEALRNIDEYLIEENVFLDYQKIKRDNFALLLLMVVMVLPRGIMAGRTNFSDSGVKLTVFYSCFLKSLTKYQFISLVRSLDERFKRINASLSGNLTSLCRCHFKLKHVYRLLLSTFGHQIVVSVLVSLTNVIFVAFLAYCAITKFDDIQHELMFGFAILWIVDEFVELARLCSSCTSMTDNANDTPVLLHKIRNGCVETDRLDDEVHSLSLQFLHQKLNISAIIFFPMDYALIYSTAIAAATYTVILIQFDVNH